MKLPQISKPLSLGEQLFQESGTHKESPCLNPIIAPAHANNHPTKESLSVFINRLGLQPHPEGGFYKEMLRLDSFVAPVDTSNHPTQERLSAGTSIYFLLDAEQNGSFSAWHRLDGLDEVWYYHAGSPMNIFWIEPDGTLITRKLGLVEGASPQVHVPKDRWFAAVVDSQDPTAFSFVSCTVFPGFEFRKFKLADRTELCRQFPEHTDVIHRFTRL
jgi:predicted cupin superfamily sugar epimerase